MKKVYAVTIGEPYEGSSVINVYSTKRKALKFLEWWIDGHHDPENWAKDPSNDVWRNFEILAIREWKVQ